MAENSQGAGSQSPINRGIQTWEFELNHRIAIILRDLEVFEDEHCIHIFYQHNRVGEISCTWRKFKSAEDYAKALDAEKSKTGIFENFFYEVFYSKGYSSVWQELGKWETYHGRKSIPYLLNAPARARWLTGGSGCSMHFTNMMVEAFAQIDKEEIDPIFSITTKAA